MFRLYRSPSFWCLSSGIAPTQLRPPSIRGLSEKKSSHQCLYFSCCVAGYFPGSPPTHASCTHPATWRPIPWFPGCSCSLTHTHTCAARAHTTAATPGRGLGLSCRTATSHLARHEQAASGCQQVWPGRCWPVPCPSPSLRAGVMGPCGPQPCRCTAASTRVLALDSSRDPSPGLSLFICGKGSGLASVPGTALGPFCSTGKTGSGHTAEVTSWGRRPPPVLSTGAAVTQACFRDPPLRIFRVCLLSPFLPIQQSGSAV